MKKREEKCSELKNINNNLTTLDLLANKSSKDEKKKTLTSKVVLVLKI